MKMVLRRVLSCLLCFSLLLSLMPVCVYAQEKGVALDFSGEGKQGKALLGAAYPADKQSMNYAQIYLEYAEPNPYKLGSDGNLRLQFYIEGEVSPEDVLDIQLSNSEPGSEKRHYSFNPYYDFRDLPQLELNIHPSPEQGFSPGIYEIYAAIYNPHEGSPEYYFCGTVEMVLAEPFLNEPVFQDVQVQLTSLYADTKAAVSFEAVFEDEYTARRAADNDCLLVLYKRAGNESIELSRTTSDLYHAGGNRCGTSPYYNNLDGITTAGSYYIEILFNHSNEEFMDQNRHILYELEIPQPPVLPSTFLVHTEQGLLATNAIGNEDVLDLRLEGWTYAPDSNFYINMLPASVEIGSPGWQNYRYRLLSYDKANTKLNNGVLYVPGIDMAYRDVYNSQVVYPIVPGEYVFYDYHGEDTKTSAPVTVIDGKTHAQPTLTGIEIASAPFKTTYQRGEALDLTGLTVKASYDITQGRLVTGFTTNPAQGEILDADTNAVTVSYIEGGNTKTAHFPITVHGTEGWTKHIINPASHVYSLTIAPGSGNHSLQGSGQHTNGSILVQSGYHGIVRLEDVNFHMEESYQCAFMIEPGANVTLDLVGANTLASGSAQAGVQVCEGAVLNISSSTGGSLKASSAMNGAGIGAGSGVYGVIPGVVSIGGNARVEAWSQYGAGIGGTSNRNSVPTVLIGGNAAVNATSEYGAGIGGGTESSSGGVGAPGGVITIRGNAQVTASSTGTAAIGGGMGAHTGGDGGNITIGDTAVVTAVSEGCTGIGGGLGGRNGRGGFGGNVVIEDNAHVTAVGKGIYAAGIGGGPNSLYSGFGGGNMGGDIRIYGGIVNTIGNYINVSGNVDIGGTKSTSTVVIEGGSVYAANGKCINPINSGNIPLQPVKLTVQDIAGNKLDNVNLLLNASYKARTGSNTVWDGSVFNAETQSGVAYVWLPQGKNTIAAVGGETCFPDSILVTASSNEFTIVLDRKAADTYPLTIAAGTGGYVSGTPSGSYAADAPISITAVPDEGYRFTSWTTTGFEPADPASAVLNFAMPAGNVTLEANFAPITVELTGLALAGSYKTTYLVGEALDLSGLTVNAVYSDGSTDTEPLTGYTVSPVAGTIFDSPGAVIIEVGYAGFTASFDVTVEPGPVKLHVIPGTIVQAHLSYIIIQYDEQQLAGASFALLDKDGGNVGDAVKGSNGKATITVTAPDVPGTYDIAAFTDGKIRTKGSIEVTAYNNNIWTVYTTNNEEGFVVLNFNEDITTKSNSLTVNGTKVTGRIVNGRSIVTSVKYADLPDNKESVFSVSGVKYPRLYPSYTFTFTATVEK